MDLNYKVFGEGKPVVILHGMFGTLDNWQAIAKQLATHFMVFIVDLRNHGRSPHSDKFDYPTMAEDVKEFMENNWIFKAHLVGHSMGGKVAMKLATDHSDMVEKLVVVDIAPKAYVGNHMDIFEALFALDLKNLKSRIEASDFLAKRIKDDGVRQFILKNLSIDKDTQEYEWKMNLPVIHKAYRHILGEGDLEHSFGGETLFIRGEKSDYILPNEFENYQKLFPNSDLATINNAGHWVHAEQPEQFLQVLTKFLLK